MRSAQARSQEGPAPVRWIFPFDSRFLEEAAMFRVIGAVVVFGFAAYGFASWWRKTYQAPLAANDSRNASEGHSRAD